MLTSPFLLLLDSEATPSSDWKGRSFCFSCKIEQASVSGIPGKDVCEGVAKRKYGIKGATGRLEREGIPGTKNTKAGASGVGFFCSLVVYGRQGG